MSTTAILKGRGAEALAKDESSFGTKPTGNWAPYLFYDDPVGEERGLDEDPILGAELDNEVDAPAAVDGLPTVAGNMVLPLDLNFIGGWLKRAFGAPSTSGASTDYVHQFSSGNDVLPTFSKEIKKAASIYYVTTGLAVNTLAFSASRKAGYDRVTAGVIGCQETKYTSSQGGTPSAIAARDPVLAVLPAFKLNSSLLGKVMSLDLSYDNKLVGGDYIGGSEHISSIERNGDAICTGNIKVRFENATLHDLAVAGTAFAGELIWQKSATRLFSIAMSQMRTERKPIPISGPGGIEVTFPFRCHQTDSDPMLTVTLKTSIASF